ncbi:MAG: TIR domain-containing protein [Candidatus Zixiibacteriota bacterium]
MKSDYFDTNSVYDAFISFRNVDADARWAIWLKNLLENYKIPQQIQKKYDLPPKLRDIYIDTNENPIDEIDENTREILQESRTLIVICSTNTPESEWVNSSVSYFQELERADKIIAILIDGEPNEAYPYALRFINRVIASDDGTIEELEEPFTPIESDFRFIRANSLRKKGRLEIYRIIATILDIDIDFLRKYDKFFKPKRNALPVLISLVIIAIILIIAFFLMQVEPKEKDKKFGAIDYKYGKPIIDAKSDNGFLYDVESKDDKIFKITAYDSSGNIIYDLQRKAIIEFNYDELDRIITRIEKKPNNDQIRKIEYHYFGSQKRKPDSSAIKITSKDGIYEINAPEIRLERIFTNRISNYTVYYDQNGFINKVFYQNKAGNIKPDTFENIYGKFFERDSLGNILKEKYLNQENEYTSRKDGVRDKLIYRSSPLRKIEFYDEHNGPVYGYIDGFAQAIFEYDENDRLIRKRYLDINGEPAYNENGISIEELEYVDKDRISRIEYFDKNHNRTCNEDGISAIEWEYSKKGYVLSIKFFDQNDNMKNCKDGYAGIEYQYNEKERVKNKFYLDTDGQRMFINRFMAGKNFFYNGLGQIIRESNIDVKGSIIPDSNGVYKKHREYDNEGNLILITHFDANDDRVVRNTIHGVQFSYDSLGYLMRKRYFDTSDETTLFRNDIGGIIYSYDSLGNLIGEKYFGQENRPIANKNGIWKWVYEYDKNGWLSSKKAVGPDGKAIRDKKNVHMYEFDYYENGLLFSIIYYNKNRKRFLNKNDISGFKLKYNRYSQITEIFLMNRHDELSLCADGYAAISFEYDSLYRVNKVLFRNDIGKIINLPDKNYAGFKIERNRFGQIKRFVFIDIAENPIVSDYGYAICERDYDISGNLIKSAFFDNKEAPVSTALGCHSVENLYDDDYNIIRRNFLDTLQNPVTNDAGFSFWTARYNKQGNLLEKRFFDEYGRPLLISQGFHRITYKYNENGKIIEKRFFNEEIDLLMGFDIENPKLYFFDDTLPIRIDKRKSGSIGKPLYLDQIIDW